MIVKLMSATCLKRRRARCRDNNAAGWECSNMFSCTCWGIDSSWKPLNLCKGKMTMGEMSQQMLATSDDALSQK